MSRIAKPCTFFTTMTHNPGDHMRYLFDGHGMAGNSHQLWTKGIKKDARERNRVAQYWDKIHEEWKQKVAKNATMTGKQVFVALPNDIQPEEIDKVAKAILKTVPQNHPATLTVHYTSGKENIKNIHLHGVISMRRGGYGATDDEYRLNSRKLAKAAVDSALKSCGYVIATNEPQYQVITRPTPDAVRWLKSQPWTKAQLRNTAFLRRVVMPQATSWKMKEWLRQEIRKAENVKNRDKDFEESLDIGRAVRWRFAKIESSRSRLDFEKSKEQHASPQHDTAPLPSKSVREPAIKKELPVENIPPYRITRKIEVFPASEIKNLFSGQQKKAAEVMQEIISNPSIVSKFGNVGAEIAGGKIARCPETNGPKVVSFTLKNSESKSEVSQVHENSKPAKR